jgi:hypothetical protein
MLRKAPLFAALLAGQFSAGAAAMEMQVVEDQIIMSGPIDGSELRRLREIAAQRRDVPVRTVILRDSPGGNLHISLMSGDFIREQGWNTAVSGYCFSGCALMFLGGGERGFTDDKPPLQTQLGFHATYYIVHGTGAEAGPENDLAIPWQAAREWMKRATDGKMTDALLERFEKLAKSDFIHFFDSNRLPRVGQISVFACSVRPGGERKCSPIYGTDVYREGIANTESLIRSNDRR